GGGLCARRHRLHADLRRAQSPAPRARGSRDDRLVRRAHPRAHRHVTGGSAAAVAGPHRSDDRRRTRRHRRRARRLSPARAPAAPHHAADHYDRRGVRAAGGGGEALRLRAAQLSDRDVRRAQEVRSASRRLPHHVRADVHHRLVARADVGALLVRRKDHRGPGDARLRGEHADRPTARRERSLDHDLDFRHRLGPGGRGRRVDRPRLQHHAADGRDPGAQGPDDHALRRVREHRRRHGRRAHPRHDRDDERRVPRPRVEGRVRLRHSHPDPPLQTDGAVRQSPADRGGPVGRCVVQAVLDSLVSVVTGVFALGEADLITIGINMIMGLSMFLPMTVGQLSFGQAGFMSIGAHIAVVLTLYAGVPFPIALVAAGLGSAVVGFLVGVPVLRLRGLLLALVTFAFAQVIEVFFLNFKPTGAAEGIRGIFPYTNLWYVYGFLVLLVLFLARLRGSRMGRAFEAVKLDETAAEAMGIDVTHAKLTAFSAGAFVAGVGGGLYAHHAVFIQYDNFDFKRGVDIAMYMVLGGMDVLYGPLLGAFVITYLSTALQFLANWRW